MPMYHLLKFNSNYPMTSGSLWNYYKDEVNDDVNKNGDNGNKINNNKIITSKSFEYKTKLVETTSKNGNILDTKAVFPL